MNRTVGIGVVIVLILAAGTGGYFIGRHGESEKKEESTEKKEPALVPVKVAKLERKEISSKTVSAYGSITALPERVMVLSAAFDSVVQKLHVTAGQKVTKDELVVEAVPSPESVLALTESRDVYAAAELDLKNVQQRYDLKLATQQELLQSQAAFRAAKLKKTSYEERHYGEMAAIKSPTEGIVSKIDFQQGQPVPSGAGIVEILPLNQIAAKLGGDPADAGNLKIDQVVSLLAVSGDHEAIEGKIAAISQRVNPDTHLIDLIVSVPDAASLPLDTNVRGVISLEKKMALIVPRQAALPAEDGKYEIFTIKDGKAVKHDVTVGIDDGEMVEITGEDLKEGDSVIIEGNQGLEENTPVISEGASATQPTTTATTREAR